MFRMGYAYRPSIPWCCPCSCEPGVHYTACNVEQAFDSDVTGPHSAGTLDCNVPEFPDVRDTGAKGLCKPDVNFPERTRAAHEGAKSRFNADLMPQRVEGEGAKRLAKVLHQTAHHGTPEEGNASAADTTATTIAARSIGGHAQAANRDIDHSNMVRIVLLLTSTTATWCASTATAARFVPCSPTCCMGCKYAALNGGGY